MTHHQRRAVHAFGRCCETSHNKLMRSTAVVVVAEVAFGAGKAQVSVDTVAIFQRVIWPWWTDHRMIVVNWLLWCRCWTCEWPRKARTWTRRWMLLRMVRMRTHHRNPHLRSVYWWHVVVDVIGDWWRRGLLQKVLQVWHLRWRPLQDFTDGFFCCFGRFRDVLF